MTDLAQRYGAHGRPRNRVVIALSGLLALAGLAWVGWVFVTVGNEPVRSELVSYDVVSDHEVTVRLDVVRRDAAVRVICTVRAVAQDHSVVGETQVSVSGLPLRQRLTADLRTERRATSVQIDSCRTQ